MALLLYQWRLEGMGNLRCKNKRTVGVRTLTKRFFFSEDEDNFEQQNI